MGFLVSGDIIINQPGQAREQMLEDVRKAIGLGLDQICLYNLVLRSYLKTPWSQDPDRIAALPVGEVAFQNWLAARNLLLESGFIQTSLSNFERADLIGKGKSFRYEEAGFKTHQYDALGFGPRAITFLKGSNGGHDAKWMNYYEAEEYCKNEERKLGEDIRFASSHFYRTPEDQLLNFVTRSLALLRVDRVLAQELIGLDPVDFYADTVATLEYAGLVEISNASIKLTVRGVFFSDSVIGLISVPREKRLRRELEDIRREREWSHEEISFGGGGM